MPPLHSPLFYIPRSNYRQVLPYSEIRLFSIFLPDSKDNRSIFVYLFNLVYLPLFISLTPFFPFPFLKTFFVTEYLPYSKKYFDFHTFHLKINEGNRNLSSVVKNAYKVAKKVTASSTTRRKKTLE